MSKEFHSIDDIDSVASIRDASELPLGLGRSVSHVYDVFMDKSFVK